MPNATAAEISGGPLTGKAVIAVRTSGTQMVPATGFVGTTDAAICLYKLDAGDDAEYLTIVDGTTATLSGQTLSISLGSQDTASKNVEGAQEILYMSTSLE
jgi:hypothetical protein